MRSMILLRRKNWKLKIKKRFIDFSRRTSGSLEMTLEANKLLDFRFSDVDLSDAFGRTPTANV
jgi:hypothetical protein